MNQSHAFTKSEWRTIKAALYYAAIIKEEKAQNGPANFDLLKEAAEFTRIADMICERPRRL